MPVLVRHQTPTPIQTRHPFILANLAKFWIRDHYLDERQRRLTLIKSSSFVVVKKKKKRIAWASAVHVSFVQCCPRATKSMQSTKQKGRKDNTQRENERRGGGVRPRRERQRGNRRRSMHSLQSVVWQRPRVLVTASLNTKTFSVYSKANPIIQRDPFMDAVLLFFTNVIEQTGRTRTNRDRERITVLTKSSKTT